MLFRLLSYSTLLCLLCCMQKAKTQDFYMLDSFYTVWSGVGDNRTIIDLNTCELSTTTTDVATNYAGIGFRALDITVTGEIGINTPVSLYIDVDLPNNIIPDGVIGYHAWLLFGTALEGPSFAPETNPIGIATDYAFESYFVGDYVSHIDDIDDIVTPLGLLPAAQRPKGQMTYREGSFYYPSVNDELIQLKVSGDHFWTRSLGSLPDTLNYGGIFSIPYSCDSTATYVLHHDPNRGSTLYHLAIPSVTLSQHCTMPYKPMAAAYDGENSLPPCNPIVLDLDINAATLNRVDTICSGTIFPLDDQIQLSPSLEFDSLVIHLQNPIDNLSEEINITATHPEVLVQLNSAHQITLVSTGFTREAPFLEVLASLSYSNNAASPSLGERIIDITAYHPHYGSSMSHLFITLADVGSLNVEPELTTPSCFGDANGTIDLLLPTAQNYNLLWEDGSTASLRTGLSGGVYTYELTDAAGCMYQDALVLDEPELLSLSISASQDSICENTGMLMAQPMGGTADYSYQWSTAEQTASLSNLSAGNYTLSILDANNCEANAEYTLYAVEVNNISIEEQACLGQSISINGQSYTQDTTFQELLQSAQGCDSLLDVQLSFYDTFYTSTAYALCAGESITINDTAIEQDTSFTVMLQSAQGCDSLEYYSVAFTPALTTSSTAEICEGEHYIFRGMELTEAAWYYDTLTASSACDSIIGLHLIVHSAAMLNIEQEGSLCNGEDVLLRVGNEFTNVQWNNNTNQSNSLSVSAPGIYTVSALDANMCETSASIELLDSPPLVDYTVSNPDCPEDKGRLEISSLTAGTAPYQLLETGQLVTAGSLLENLAVGAHQYTLVDATGCEAALNFNVLAATDLVVSLPEDLTLNLGESVELTAIPNFTASNINWQPAIELSCSDCLSPIASPSSSTIYQLTLANDNNCIWEGQVSILVEQQGIYIPNAFSPNGDGSNERFEPEINSAVTQINGIQIFDRWGALVFESTADTPYWDGQINGEAAPQGIYVYHIEWTDISGKLQQERGDVMLVR